MRLFRNRPELRWEYRVHEQIMPAIRRAGVDARLTDIAILHGGYQDPSLREAKLERNRRLLEVGHAEKPDDPVILFQLGWAELNRGRLAAAVQLLERSVRLFPREVSVGGKARGLLAQAYHRLGQAAHALAILREGQALFPDDGELLFLEGIVRLETNDFAGAETCLRRLLAKPVGDCRSGVDLALYGYKARNLLAQVYAQWGRLADAEREWRAVLHEQPSLQAARDGLRNVLLARGRVAEALATSPGEPSESRE